MVSDSVSGQEEFQENGMEAEGKGDSAKAVLERAFLFVSGDDCAPLAEMTAFRGMGNTDEDYKRACDYSKPDERVTVDKICAQIKVLLHNAMATTFEEYSEEEQKEGFWHVWRVRFDYLDGSSSHSTFGLIESMGALLLGDID
jgi:hypothetical protein